MFNINYSEINRSNKFLAHYGVLGMRWGKRKGGSKGPTGMHKKVVDAFLGTKSGSQYKLHKSAKKESAEVEGKAPSKNKKLPDHADHITKKKLKNKPIRTMSNDEIKTLTTRLQLEKTLKDLTKPEVSKGKKVVTDLLMGVAKQTASAYIGKAVTAGIETVIKVAIEQLKK
jgi:uncharacterized protein YlaI